MAMADVKGAPEFYFSYVLQFDDGTFYVATQMPRPHGLLNTRWESPRLLLTEGTSVCEWQCLSEREKRLNTMSNEFRMLSGQDLTAWRP